ncbi:MAG: ABC transporter substrate-binding protein [Streptococcaceae bacterium]|jgi:putative ABC transport system substrate-binding protein|nr:ABC transporter substrate-binding protein [Streptococcaceae bacterium]
MQNKKMIGVILTLFIILSIFLGKEIWSKNFVKDLKSSKEKTVGVLQFVSHPDLDRIYQGIQKGLFDEGFKKKKNLKVIFKNAQADQSKLKTMSEELIENHSDVLVGIATPAAQALANQTKDVPIVLGAISDPVAAGLIKNEKRPGSNVTGVSDRSSVASQIFLAKKLLKSAKKVGILYSSAEDSAKFQVIDVKKAAQNKNFLVKEYPVPSTNEINQIINKMVDEVDFIYIPNDNTIASAMPMVVKIADEKKIPIIPVTEKMVKEGGLATNGLDQFRLGVQAGRMISQILKGRNPATMPIFTFKAGKIVINTKKAKKFGIKIPEDILKKAKKVS